MAEKIVITGMGTVNAVGKSVEESWQNAVNGVSGLGPITLFDSSDHLVKVACEIKDFDPTLYVDPRETRRRDRYELFAAAAAQQAIQQSGLEITEKNAARIGTVISAAVGGLTSMEEGVLAAFQEGPRRVSPFMIPMLMPNGAAGLVGIDHGPKGPALSVASACASGQDGIGTAWMMLRSGMIDVAIAGAAEAVITKTAVSAFDRMQAMSRRLEGTPSPFDKRRDGLVIGEGAAVLVMETESHAKARGATILAELAGYSSSADAYHITAPHSEGIGGAQAIRNALDVAGINLDQVDYINAHGTGTVLNDLSETRAIKSVFGEQAYKLAVSSTKGVTGHMMGATGALETIFCVQTIRNGLIAPTINYLEPDPDCDLDYVPNKARETKVDVALTNAFGFGGHNAVLAVRKYQ
ncbi:MAG: beta-ketoacyl-ACP synthase II [Anaerolineales bacterium]|nr:beta-ketoacyl-ACP synthase II [Anaerolineales bacterium]MCW5856255.1 beta-ketoacyl-ACP synthase II [Anaerolineales bacterium]